MNEGAAMSAVAALIVNYETRDALRRCLDSLALARPAETIVVDNASSDGSAALVESEFPLVRLIANRENIGFGSAVNQAARASTAPFLLVLNADTRVADDSCERVASYLWEHPRVGAIGPRLVGPDGRLQSTCRPFPATARWLVDNEVVAPALARAPWIREHLYVSWRHDAPRRVPWIVGAAIGLRRSAFEEIGGFDQRFFLYFEEVDLFYRLSRRGWQIHFAPITTVEHAGGASTALAWSDNEVRLLAGHLLFLRLHASMPRRWAAVAALKLFECGRLIRRGLALANADDRVKRERARQHFSASARRLLQTW